MAGRGRPGRVAAIVLAVVPVAVAVVLSARPGVPEGPAPPAASGASERTSVDCEEAAAKHRLLVQAHEIQRVAAMDSGTARMYAYSVSGDCKDEIARAKRQPLSGPLADCVRLARKVEKEYGHKPQPVLPSASPDPQTTDERRLDDCEDLANKYAGD
ncbi:hypothetical protein [Streptomyces boninensis]|uniref:hypothetical protein n=1 Tax=Streptomyces boninensis TaxID=2039455 RepID=UPI003B223FE2